MKTRGPYLTPYGIRTICTIGACVVILAFSAALAFGLLP